MEVTKVEFGKQALGCFMSPPKWLRKQLSIKIRRQLGISTHHRYHGRINSQSYEWECVCQFTRIGMYLQRDPARVTLYTYHGSQSPHVQRHLLYAHFTQIPECPYAHIPESISTNELKLMGRRTRDLKSEIEIFHWESFMWYEFYMSTYEITGLFNLSASSIKL